MQKDFLAWRYELTYEYRRNRYKRYYGKFKRKTKWSLDYWKKPIHWFLELYQILSGINIMFCFTMISYSFSDGFDFVSFLLGIIICMPIFILNIIWIITGKKAIQKYKKTEKTTKTQIKEMSNIKYNKKEYTEFWENQLK